MFEDYKAVADRLIARHLGQYVSPVMAPLAVDDNDDNDAVEDWCPDYGVFIDEPATEGCCA